MMGRTQRGAGTWWPPAGRHPRPTEDGSHGVRLARYCLDVGLPVTQGCEQPFSLRLCPWFQRHGATIPSLLDQAEGVLLAGLMVIILAGGEGALTIGAKTTRSE